MTLEVLISTMFQSDRSLIDKIGLDCNAVVVNQGDTDSIEQFEYNGHRIIWINSSQRGLSKSRNLALANASADLCLLVDDDERLAKDYKDNIISAFKCHPEAGVIGFQAEGIDAVFKTYYREERKIGYIRSMRMASVEIAFRRNALIKNNIWFNEQIGAGTRYKMGEENTILFECLSSGIHIYYVPILICRIKVGGSTWFSGFDSDYFHARGAVFTAMSRKWSLLLIMQFAIRKYHRYKSNIGLIDSIRYMLSGRTEYLKLTDK